ncbi:MAG: DeoR family transcriptional regulator [Candidatus Veblenbacteria bacterium]|nr:DeoR family transcriptional regulator [Candidatus Veblenbacteria bacterium]MDZ4230014.1 DeoR family transcriptional regulator [Candidatus Veblenbacteria bacterium]
MLTQERHHRLLGEVVRSYMREAEPVGSKALEDSLGVSSATIRNDMVRLEEEGYLRQPHTSAGRLPTPKAYRFYLEHLVQAQEPQAHEQKLLRDVVKRERQGVEPAAKELARSLAELAHEAAVVAFSPEHTYYTGLSNLFQQPEFSDVDMVRSLGYVIDHLDEGLRQLLRQGDTEVQVRLGADNPLGADCAIIYMNLRLRRQPVFVGLFGPVRMDYDANIGRLHYVAQLFTT